MVYYIIEELAYSAYTKPTLPREIKCMFDRMRRRLDNSRRRSSQLIKRRASLLPRLEAIRQNAVQEELTLKEDFNRKPYVKLTVLITCLIIALVCLFNQKATFLVVKITSAIFYSTYIANFGETILSFLDLLAIICIAAWFVINGQLQIGKPMTGQWLSD